MQMTLALLSTAIIIATSQAQAQKFCGNAYNGTMTLELTPQEMTAQISYELTSIAGSKQTGSATYWEGLGRPTRSPLPYYSKVKSSVEDGGFDPAPRTIVLFTYDRNGDDEIDQIHLSEWDRGSIKLVPCE